MLLTETAEVADFQVQAVGTAATSPTLEVAVEAVVAATAAVEPVAEVAAAVVAVAAEAVAVVRATVRSAEFCGPRMRQTQANISRSWSERF
jgi:hypothetical protein